MKKKVILFLTAVLLTIMFPAIVSASTFFATDVTTASPGKSLVGLHGTYRMDSDKVINRINEIRMEACRQGVKNPSTGRPLTTADYVPIKWSYELEYIAKIRAAESCISKAHIRTNGDICFELKSPSGLRASGEVLAWCDGYDVVYPVEMWYEEKYDWVHSTGNVTGHYTLMIDPKNKYFGMGYFEPEGNDGWGCGAGEFSYRGSHSEGTSNFTQYGVQILEVEDGYFENIGTVTGKTSGAVGESSQLRVTVETKNIEKIDVLGSLGWSSSDQNVATIAQDGTVTGHSCGTTIITALINGHASSVKYTVDHKYLKEDVTVEADCVNPGKKTAVCQFCGQTVAWEIPTLGHSFDSLQVLKEPTIYEAGQRSRTCQRCGYTEYSTTPKLPSGGQLNATSLPLKIKKTVTLKVAGLAGGNYVKSWSSSNTKYATVDKNGKVTGKKKGTAKITASLASGEILTATIKVQPNTVKTTSLSVNKKSVTLKRGENFQLTASRAPITSGYGISYSTKNSKIAAVSKTGKITAKKPGSTYIYVKSGSKKVTVKVKVEGVKTTKLTANATKKTVNRGKSFSWKVIKSPTNSTEGITYSTSNKRVATVNSSGKITGKKKGIVTITAKSGSQKISIRISVR